MRSLRILPPPEARAALLPSTLAPQLIAQTKLETNDWSNWLLELKYDGFRILARVEGRKISLWTRGGHNWTDRLEPLRRELARLLLVDGWYDGEIIVADVNGRPDFGMLQQAFERGGASRITYMVFDAPFLNGWDMRQVRLEERRKLLRAALPLAGNRVQFSKELTGPVNDLLEAACALNLEGLVAKRRDAPYVSRRAPSWRKLKCGQRAEFVIAGYTRMRTGVRSLILAAEVDSGGLRYVGSVSSGFTELMRSQLLYVFGQVACADCPITEGDVSRYRCYWLQPRLVAEINYAEITRTGAVRHPVLKGVKVRG